MADLAALKAKIADDIDDYDSYYASNIASAITYAIGYHERERFYFNETRDLTFATVENQQWYDTSDEDDIPTLLHIDGMWLIDSGANQKPLCRAMPQEIETWTDNADVLSGAGTANNPKGEPSRWAYFGQRIRLHPVPDAGPYWVRIQAHYKLPALASDSEEHAWTNDAFDLIVARAEIYLARGKLRSPELGNLAAAAEAEELARLRSITSMKNGTGVIRPTCF
jgi:hypothetical protein